MTNDPERGLLPEAVRVAAEALALGYRLSDGTVEYRDDLRDLPSFAASVRRHTDEAAVVVDGLRRAGLLPSDENRSRRDVQRSAPEASGS